MYRAFDTNLRLFHSTGIQMTLLARRRTQVKPVLYGKNGDP